MTVAELIEKLKEFPQDAVVRIRFEPPALFTILVDQPTRTPLDTHPTTSAS